MSVPILEVADLQAGYGEMPIIRGVSVNVDPGEIVCIIGPNGAGKSTLLKGIMGLLKIFSGGIVFEGQPITHVAVEKRVQIGIGYVPQVANVFVTLTVKENLLLSIRDKREQWNAVDKILTFFPELKPKLSMSAGAMSGGERQMLAFARCLIAQPRLLLLDEPTAALSPKLVGSIFDKISEIRNFGTAILLVEQNAIRALKISDRAIVLANGQNAAEGTGSELLKNPRIKDLYLGGMTIPPGTPPGNA
jgi:ABC-type branched-subunit amino acid transport system ATPase component